MLDILVVSPIPSHPRNQGNSARIASMTGALQSIGARIHFIYVALEGADPQCRISMRNAWDTFDLVWPTRQLRRSRAECYALDDWYEPELDKLLAETFRTRAYDMVIVNYVWFSKAFKSAPTHCLKVLDTHDVFGDRHSRLIQDGIKPAWYYTTAVEEGVGLDRADLVIAIQNEEAEVFRQRSKTPVCVIGHLLPESFLPSRTAGGRLRVGYLASGNPSNIYSLQELSATLRRRPDVADRFEFRLYGTICDHYAGDISPFRRIGPVARVEQAYEACDIVLNPNISGSGLKIKTVEALSFGRPLLATVGAMVGIETDAPAHLCGSLDEMVDRLGTIGTIEGLAMQSRSTFMRYQRAQCIAIGSLYDRGAACRERRQAAKSARAA